MLIASGGGGGLFSGLGEEESEFAGDDINSQFASRVYRSNTKAQKQTATRIGNLRAVVAQGRMIEASLETAINTQLPGSIRAIVSRDVYAEAGHTVMIPKGSRLIGQYNSSIFSGQTRVYVVWTRVIRPDGIDVAINSPLTDQIGQTGVAGQVDTKFGEILSRALLTSAISISVAAVIDEAFDGGDLTQTTNTDGSNTTNTDLTTQASVDAVSQFGGIMSSFLRRFIDVQPTILVDQGASVNVFVNRDLIFPANLTGARFIP
jgi:type IV secretion system protein VirB10